MARRPIPVLDAEFANVMSFLRERGVVPDSPPGTTVDGAKRIHRVTHSLILWRFRLKGLSEHGRVFIEEIASDALQILPQALMGYEKTAKLLTRGIIENVLRNIYFSDHPVEFARMNRGTKWYLSMEELFEYPKMVQTLADLETRFDALNRLNTLYGELSAGIHGRTVRDLEMRTALNKIKCDAVSLTKQAALTERCGEAASFLLAAFHREKFAAFQTDDRQIILRTMPPRARQAIADI